MSVPKNYKAGNKLPVNKIDDQVPVFVDDGSVAAAEEPAAEAEDHSDTSIHAAPLGSPIKALIFLMRSLKAHDGVAHADQEEFDGLYADLVRISAMDEDHS